MNKLIILITILAFVIRVYQPNYPPLLWDEAALGYNAYSILKTGADEYGRFLPLILKSFGDYKPALYSFLDIPFVAVFGLTPLAVRLPSIILGSLTPLLLYLLIKNKKLAVTAALLLAFNPYNIHFSRGAWETNILTFELLLAALFFLKSRFFLSAFVFGLSLYTYQGAKFISAFLILILLFQISPTIPNLFQNLATKFILPLFVFSLPLAFSLLFNSAANRLQVASIFSYPPPANTSPLVYYPQQILLHYFNHFSPEFLIFKGDWQNPRHSAPYIGVLLYPSLVFLILGIFNKMNKVSKFLLLWLLVAPLPAAFTRDQVHAVRSMSLSVPLVYFTALGLSKIKNSKLKTLTLISYILALVYYNDLYYHHMVKTNPQNWLYGYRQATTYLINHQSSFQNIYFTNFYGQPYIYYLFYSAYPPKKYQSQAKLITTSVDTGTVAQIDHIRFTSTPSPQSLPPNSLAIYSHDELLRFGLNPKNFLPLSPINNISTFYAYHN